MFRIGFLLLAFSFFACSPRSVVLTRSRLLMGNVPVNLSLKIDPAQQAEALQAGDRAYDLAKALEAKISEFQPASEISCLNQNAGRSPCPLSPETLGLLKLALSFSKMTDGAFDIRFASLSAEGGSGEIILKDQPPSGFLRHPETRIGLGAIGKGWIVDRMIEALRTQGFDQALVDAGGDLRASGGPWKVAIQIPQDEPGKFSEPQTLVDRALATSGLYERGNHIVDPQSRKAAQRKGSVSVEAEDLSTADALSTAFFVMGEKKSGPYLKKFPKLRVTWLEPKSQGHMISEERSPIGQ